MLVTQKELNNLKLKSIKIDVLRELADSLGLNTKGKASELVTRLIDIPSNRIDEFIKRKYQDQIKQRQKIITDNNLKKELMKVSDFKWGVVQGQLDQKIQTEYVRKIVKYNDLINGIKNRLHNDITGYVVASWYNHWTTVLIEDHISQHQKVVPTLKNNFGIDIFFDNQPFDLKVTYPTEYIKKYGIRKTLEYPTNLMIWLYEKQGPQRFGADNRLFVVMIDKNNPEQSWKLKRDFYFIFSEIDNFFNKASVSTKDEIIFTFKKRTYTTISKILIITK